MPRVVRLKSKSPTTDPRLRLLNDLWSDLHKALQTVLRNPTSVAVHDARVAARTLRALLRSLRDEMNPSAYAQLRFDLTNLSRDFAAVRTADIHVKIVDALLTNHSHANTKDRTSLNALLERMAGSERRALSKRMQEPAWQQRLHRIAEVMESSELLLKAQRLAADEYRTMLVASINESLRALRKHEPDMHVLHKQRIRIKNTRYVCELLATLVASNTQRLQNQLNKAQDILGDIHDLHALDHWLNTKSIPTPLAKPLVKQSQKQQAKLLKKFQRMQPSLCKCLSKTAESIRKTMA